MHRKPTFETLKSEEIKFGKNNFIEVARKKAITEEGEREFLSIARGFYSQDNVKKYKSTIAMPVEDEFVEEFKKAINSL